jgi:hypothetical protein
VALSELWNRLRSNLGRAAPTPPASATGMETASRDDVSQKTKKALTYTDVDLNDPADALRALRRASRTPPHQRHLSTSVEEHLSAYSPPKPTEASPPELRVIKGKSVA